MKLSIADLDWSLLTERERWTLENVIPRIEKGYDLKEIARELGEPHETIAADVERLAAHVMALSGRNELPPHTPEEYAALKASIDAVGQVFPILKGSSSSGLPGEIIDGHARNRVCAELRIHAEVRELDGSAEELRALAVALNVARRHLSSTARRGIIRVELLRNPERSDRTIATAAGVSPSTVGSVRRELEQQGAVSKLDTRVGRDGVPRPASQPAAAPPLAASDRERTVRVIIAAELFEQYVGPWVSCTGFRLVERRPGVHELQVQLLNPVLATTAGRRLFQDAIGPVGQSLGRDPDEIAAELLQNASEVFDREILTPSELYQDELEWALLRLAELQEMTADAG